MKLDSAIDGFKDETNGKLSVSGQSESGSASPNHKFRLILLISRLYLNRSVPETEKVPSNRGLPYQLKCYQTEKLRLWIFLLVVWTSPTLNCPEGFFWSCNAFLKIHWKKCSKFHMLIFSIDILSLNQNSSCCICATKRNLKLKNKRKPKTISWNLWKIVSWQLPMTFFWSTSCSFFQSFPT